MRVRVPPNSIDGNRTRTHLQTEETHTSPYLVTTNRSPTRNCSRLGSRTATLVPQRESRTTLCSSSCVCVGDAV